MSIQIFVNGQAREAAAAASVEMLLNDLGLAGKPVVVEWNEQALLPREYATTLLKKEDQVEIVQITAGG